METATDTLARIYALEPVDALCARCREHTSMRIIVLQPAAALARTPRPVHASAFWSVAPDEDDLAYATWEDAEWQ